MLSPCPNPSPGSTCDHEAPVLSPPHAAPPLDPRTVGTAWVVMHDDQGWGGGQHRFLSASVTTASALWSRNCQQLSALNVSCVPPLAPPNAPAATFVPKASSQSGGRIYSPLNKRGLAQHTHPDATESASENCHMEYEWETYYLRKL